MSDERALDDFIRRIARGRRAGGFLGALIFGAVSALFLLFAWISDAGYAYRGWLIMAGIFGLVVLMCLYQAVTANRDNAGLDVLKRRRSEVVWAYVLRNQGIVLGLSSGATTIVEGVGPADLDVVASFVPQATLGYSPSLEEQFRKDPPSLRRT